MTTKSDQPKLNPSRVKQRKGYFIEIDPHYVDVAVQRWENYTGKKAVRDVDS